MFPPEVAERDHPPKPKTASGLKILVADDDPVSRKLMIGILNSGDLGYDILTATDGLKAWETLEANPDVKVAILDLSMPGLSGMDLIDRMRGDARFAMIPVIICTANSDRATVVAAATRGVSHFLAKPFARTTVLEKVWQICRPSKQGVPVLANLTEVRKALEIDRDTHRELLEQVIRMADMWATNTQRVGDHPRLRSLVILAARLRANFTELGALALAARFQEFEDGLAMYKRKPMQSEEANSHRVCRGLGEKIQRELDRLREGIHTLA